MKTFFTAFKNYQYKFVTALVVCILSAGIYNFTPVDSLAATIAGGVSLTCLAGIGLYILSAAGRGIYNTYTQDGSKGLAIALGVAFLAFISLLVYLFAVVLPAANK
jgi:hypothetical protein